MVRPPVRSPARANFFTNRFTRVPGAGFSSFGSSSLDEAGGGSGWSATQLCYFSRLDRA